MVNGMLLKGLLSLAVLGMLFGGCEDDTKETTVQDTKPVAQVEQQVEVKEETIIEKDIETEYKVYDLQNNPDALNEAQENEAIEIVGKVGSIRKTGEIGGVMQLDLEYTDDWSGYSIEVTGFYEDMKDLKDGETIKVQGFYRGVGKWTLCLEGENIGAHKVAYRNIYKIK